MIQLLGTTRADCPFLSLSPYSSLLVKIAHEEEPNSLTIVTAIVVAAAVVVLVVDVIVVHRMLMSMATRRQMDINKSTHCHRMHICHTANDR